MVQMEHKIPDNNHIKNLTMSCTCLCQTISIYNIFSVLQGYQYLTGEIHVKIINKSISGHNKIQISCDFFGLNIYALHRQYFVDHITY